uniref:RING-type domain-containing protein n=1 Tax=viral metagenome TaxID=1070528 RepID=A0A6C0B600_9ZZZZ
MSSPSQKKPKLEECPVCMEDMTKDKIAKTFSCGKHKTCGKCYAGIMTTNTQNCACPLCRKKEQLLGIEEWTQIMYAHRDKLSKAELLRLLAIMTEHKSQLNPEDIPEHMYRDLPPSPPKASSLSVKPPSPPRTSSSSAKASSSPTFAELTRLAQLQSKGTLGKRKGGQKKRGTTKKRR